MTKLKIYRLQKLGLKTLFTFLFLRKKFLFLFFVAFQFFQSQIYVSEGTFIYSSSEIIVQEATNYVLEENIESKKDHAKIFVLGGAEVIHDGSLQNAELVYFDRRDEKDISKYASSSKKPKRNKKNVVIKNYSKKKIKEQLYDVYFNHLNGNSSEFFSSKSTFNVFTLNSSSFKLKKNIEQYSVDYTFYSYFLVKSKVLELCANFNYQFFDFYLSVRPPPVSS